MSRLLLLLLIITLSLFPIHTFSLNVTKINLKSSITASNNTIPWRSPGGDFSLGFQSLKNDSTNYVVAIWFSVVPSQTMAWFARNCKPAPLGSTLTLKADGFIVQDSKQNRLCNVNGNLSGVAYASLSDDGNLVLSTGDSTSLWESFKYPTDTILPTQTIEIGTQLISKKSESDFSMGRFYARMTPDGFLLNTKTIASNSGFETEYYNSQSPGDHVLFSQNSDNNAVISVVSKSGATVKSILRSNVTYFNLTSSSGYYYRATIDSDGVFSMYYFSKTAFDWVAVASLPEDACMSIMGDKGSGACGFNNVCYLQNRKPVCNCTEGFSLVDKSNPYGDCKSNFTESCGQGGTGKCSLVAVKDVDWPLNDYEQIDPSTLNECQKACTGDIFCGAAIFRNNSCWKKRLPLSNGRHDISLGATAFLKVGKGY